MYRTEHPRQPIPPVYQTNGHHIPPQQEYDQKYDPQTVVDYHYQQQTQQQSLPTNNAMSQYRQQQPEAQMPPQQAQQQVIPQRDSPLQPKGCVSGGKYYTLDVAQQPDRARMCGFGDKDRRPITPPPCIRLIIKEAGNEGEIEYDSIDAQHFILQVDLWNEDGTQAVNCVQHSNTSPSVSISMATTTSYPPQPDQGYGHMGMHGMPGGQGGQYMHNQGAPNAYYHGGVSNYAFPGGQPGHIVPNVAQVAGNYTRNLIGSCSVSAAQLGDVEEKVGLWFVLQDLSVRTEGSFRLKFSFINVGLVDGGLNIGFAPVLASAFSDVFTVWSAKKFPGVKESTALSKCFATQGVKIPIRKDGGGKGGGNGAGASGDFDEDNE